MVTTKASAGKSPAKKTASKGVARRPAAKKAAAPRASTTAARKPYGENTPVDTTPARTRPNDAIDLLVDDHLAAAKCFAQYEKLAKKGAPASERKATAEKVCGMLKVHTAIEEEIFYPAARAAGIEADMMDEAVIEHASAKDLIAQIEGSDPSADFYDAKVKVLGDYIAHHVVEEHTEMFPKCRRSKMDLLVLRKQLEARKKQLQAAAL